MKGKAPTSRDMTLNLPGPPESLVDNGINLAAAAT